MKQVIELIEKLEWRKSIMQEQRKKADDYHRFVYKERIADMGDFIADLKNIVTEAKNLHKPDVMLSLPSDEDIQQKAIDEFPIYPNRKPPISWQEFITQQRITFKNCARWLKEEISKRGNGA